MTNSYFSDLFDYDSSVNRQLLNRLSGLSSVEEKTQDIFAHLLSAKKVWIKRLNGEDLSGVVIWPDLQWNECEVLIKENEEAYRSFLSEKTEDDLKAKLYYQNSKGTDFQTPIQDILSHVLIHGSHHRGQIAKAIREAGAEPINTDYITYVRNQQAS